MGELRQISDYKVVDVLGRGGMGVVYEAIHANGAPAAVKTVRVATESTLESIRREIVMLRELEHPGVVRIRDHGVAADGMPWYAMELLRGRTLRDDFRVWFPEPVKPDDSTKDLKAPGRQRTRDEPLARVPMAWTPPYSLTHVAALFAKICDPLAYVHGQGVIHRDLSPGNIFLVGPDDPVLFDFGLASQFHPDGAREVLEVGGYARGTAHYMAPEQARGEVVDARADIYALGCILYEALTGRPPFLDDGVTSVLVQHIEAVPLAPSTRAPLSAPFDELVLRMLAKSPRDRLGYVEDVAKVLGRIAGLSESARPRARAYTYRPRLAGREAVIKELDPYIARVAGGVGCGAALVGESGAGKTRLAGEIATRAASQWDLRVITGECQPVAIGEDVRAAPLHPLRPLLRAIADRCREGGRTESERLLGADGGLLAAYEPALAGFAKTIDRVGGGGMGGAAQRYRVLAVLRDVVAAMTIAEPVLLVIDDLQWADELTLAFLRSLTQTWFSRTALMVLVTVRSNEVSPELTATLAGLRAETYAVTRLGRDAVGAMVRDMLALDEEVPALADYVAKRSEGNPLFAAEYLRIAVEEGVVERDAGGRWRLAARDDDSYDHLPTPGSVQELGRRRLGMLSSDARELAIAAAVLGRTCEPDVLAKTASSSSESARGGVAELIVKRVVEEVDGQLRFEHDSLRELAYAALTDETRRELHRRAAIAVEERHGHDADFGLRLAELAHHWEQAGDRARAIDYLERAADHALDTAAYGEARVLLDRLLALATDAPAAKRGRWLRRIGEAAYALGDVEGLATYSRAALDALGRPLPSSKVKLAAAVMSGLGQQVWTRTLRRRAPAAPAEPAIVEAALASAQMTTHFFFNDDSVGLVGAALTAVNLAERGGDNLPIAEIYAQLGYAAGLARLGGVARTYFAQAEATASRTRDTLGLCRTRMCEAAFAIGTGAWGDARDTAGEALELARSIRNPQEAEDALTILGHAEFATGHYDAARALAIELRDSARQRANVQHEAWGIYTEGRAALYTGDLEGAIERFDAAMPIVSSIHDRASQILCGGMLAAALARRGDARARAVADATWDRIGGRTPPVFSITEGLVGLCDAYLALVASGDASLVPRAKAAIAELAKLSRLLPIAGPPADNRLGRLYALTGARRRAARAFAKGRAAAERLSMPFEARYEGSFAEAAPRAR